MSNILHENSIVEFNDFKIFNAEDKKYVFSAPDNKIFEIDDKVEKLISLSGEEYETILGKMKPYYSKEELEVVLNTMNKAGFLNNSKVADYSVKELKSLTLLLVQGCNLRCSYCYAEDGKYNDFGEMNKEIAFQAVDFLIESTKLKDLGICFFGGEPLLKFQLIKDIVGYCKTKEREQGKKFHYSMTTNGTLITDEIEKFIIENQISTQISIDGDEKTHNLHRFFSDKTGTHSYVMEKTKELRARKRLTARATITKESIANLKENYLFLLGNGFKSIAMSATFDILDSNDFNNLTKAFINLYEHCEKLIKTGEFEKVRNHKMFMQELQRIHKASRSDIACGVGRYTYAIDVHGDIYPCQRFVSNKEFCLGNVYKKDSGRQEFLNKISFEKHDDCKKCWVRNLCKGGCAHVNLSMTGSVNKPAYEYCKHIRTINDYLIRIYLRLSDVEINHLFEKKAERNNKRKEKM